MKMKPISIIIVVVLILILSGSMFTVNMKQNAIVLQFQEYKETITKPGLYFKIPLLQEVRFFTKMLLVLDAPPADIITRDKKTMVIDNFSMWRIKDPLLFLQTLQSEQAGESRLDDIIKSELRVELGTHNLIDVVTITREEIMAKVTHEANIKAAEYGIEVQLDGVLTEVDKLLQDATAAADFDVPPACGELFGLFGRGIGQAL